MHVNGLKLTHKIKQSIEERLPLKGSRSFFIIRPKRALECLINRNNRILLLVLQLYELDLRIGV